MITVTVVVDNMPRLGESTTEDYNRHRISLGKLDPKGQVHAPVILDHDWARGRGVWPKGAVALGGHDGDHQVLCFDISAHLKFPSSDSEEWTSEWRRVQRRGGVAEHWQKTAVEDGRHDHASDKVMVCHDGRIDFGYTAVLS